MSGRFLTLPLFAAVLILSRAVPFERARALTAASLLAVVGLTSAQIPLLSDSRVERTDATMDPRVSGGVGVVDERAFYFQEQSLLLANRQSFPPPEWPTGATQPVPTSVEADCGELGIRGLEGPLTHLLDECALADPLLARLPAAYNSEWRIGHFIRLIPEGYSESLQQDVNLLADIGIRPIYDDLRLITRAPRLLSRARLAAIWRVNTGADQQQIDHRFYRFGDSGGGPVIHVRWVETLEYVQRATLERSLGLYRAAHRGGTTWSYRVLDASLQRLRAIVAHDMVADTYGIRPRKPGTGCVGGRRLAIHGLAIQPLVYASGWHPAESDPTWPESTWQWTQQTATLSFANPNADAAFYLDYTARPDLVTGAPQTVTVRAGDQVLHSFVTHTAGRRLRRIPIPADGAGLWGHSRDSDRRGPDVRAGNPARRRRTRRT